VRWRHKRVGGGRVGGDGIVTWEKKRGGVRVAAARGGWGLVEWERGGRGGGSGLKREKCGVVVGYRGRRGKELGGETRGGWGGEGVGRGEMGVRRRERKGGGGEGGGEWWAGGAIGLEKGRGEADWSTVKEKNGEGIGKVKGEGSWGRGREFWGNR